MITQYRRDIFTFDYSLIIVANIFYFIHKYGLRNNTESVFSNVSLFTEGPDVTEMKKQEVTNETKNKAAVEPPARRSRCLQKQAKYL